MTVQAFWLLLHWVNTLSPAHTCEAVTQSTHGIPATRFPVVFGGSCSQAFLTALKSAGSIAWEIVA